MRDPRTIVGAALALAAIGAAPAGAASGIPDPTFGGGDGLTSIAYPDGAAVGRVIVPAEDGFAALGETTRRKGRIIVAGIGSDGRDDSSFFGSRTAWDSASPTVVDATRSAGQRLVVAVNGTPGDEFPPRIRLLGTGAGGRPDGVFGGTGTLDVAEPGRAVRLLNAPDGRILIAAERTRATGDLTSGAMLVRSSPDGVELGAATIPLSGNASIGGAVRLADGSVLMVGSDPRLFLVRFKPDGSADTGFGAGGVLHLDVHQVQIDDARLDPAGRVVIVGARIGDLGRDVDAPVRPLLLRLNAAGTALDTSIQAIGRRPGLVDELTSVATRGNRIYASTPDGRVAAFARANGQPVPRFGVAGISAPPPGVIDEADGLLASGDGALLVGSSYPSKGFKTRLAVLRVRFAGRGILRPRRGKWVTLTRAGGKVTIRTELGARDQAIGAGIAAPLVPRKIDGGDGFFFTPPGVVGGAGKGSVRVTGSGGTAVVRHARFTPYRAKGRVAELDLAKPACGATSRARIRLAGAFAVRTGRVVVRNHSHTALLLISRRCGQPTKVKVLRGKAKVT